MGALDLFSFDGRINRLGLLWRGLLGGVLIGGLGVLATFCIDYALRPQSLTGAEAWTQWVMTGALLLALWNVAALTSRRLRDMGLEPTHIVPLYAALWVVNEVLLAPMSQMQPQTYGSLESGWQLAQVAVLIALLVFPSRAAQAPARPHYEPAEPTRALNWRQSGG